MLKVPGDFAIEAAIAVGRPGPADALSDALRQREAPNGRRPIADLVAPGVFAW